MAKFAPGEHCMLLVTQKCACDDPTHHPITAGSEVVIEGVGPFGPGFTVVGGVSGWLTERFDYWIATPGGEPMRGFLVWENELSKLAPLSELIEHEDEVIA